MGALDLFDEKVVAPSLGVLDALRLGFLKHGGAVSKAFVRRRSHRAVAMSVFACATALILSVRWTGYLLLIGPLVFGAPHLVAEARYLFFQQHRANTALLVVLAVQTIFAFAGLGIYALGFTIALALVVTRDRAPRMRANWRDERSGALITDGALVAAALFVEAAALLAPARTRFALLHVHNGVSLLVWLVWRRRPAKLSIVVAALLSAGAIAITAGVFDRCAIHTPLRDTTFSLTKITDAVAAGCPGPWRHRFLFLFAFMQSIHYAIWVRLLPEEARDRETPRSFSASWKAFKEDSGGNVARLALLTALAVPAFAFLIGPVRARSLYVTVSEFHATVEMVLIFVLFRKSVRTSGKQCSRRSTRASGRQQQQAVAEG